MAAFFFFACVTRATPTSPAYASAVLADNPVGYWRLDETNNTFGGTLVAVDTTGNFNGVYGSASVDALPGATPPLGFLGFDNVNKAARFTNGLGQSYVTIPALNLKTNTVTITAWIYPLGTPANYTGIVYCRNASDACGFNFSQSGQLGYTWNQGSANTYNWQSGLVPPPRQWSFIALVVSPSNAIAYLCNTNGQNSATNLVANNNEAFSGASLIGADPYDNSTGGRTFNGVMDEVAIFNSSLTPMQVWNLYFVATEGPLQVSAPTISPSNMVYAGNTVMFSASAFGLPPFQYQWQANGVSLADATNSSLVLTNAQVANSGNYQLVVSNSYGALTSSVAALDVVLSIPVVVSDITPLSVADYVGQQQTFSANFTGTLPMAYQWQVNTGSGMTNIPNATNTLLTLSSLQLANAGSYQVLATNSTGGPVASSMANLTVLTPPAYVSAMLAANPVGYWRLNETGDTSSGTLVAVDATHNFDGVYGSAAEDGVPGLMPYLGFAGFETNNTAVEFTNGVANSFVTLPALNLKTNTVTITAWVMPIGTPANFAGIVSYRNGSDACGLNFGQIGQVGYTWNQDNVDTYYWQSGLVPPPGQWSFIALAVSPSNAVVYLCNANGPTSATNWVVSAFEDFSGPTLIGDDNADGGTGSRTFNGVMSEVAVFNSLLTPMQLSNLYFLGTGPAHAATYYVDVTNGNNSWTGTTSNHVIGNIGPLANFEAFRQGAYPPIVLNPGDTVYAMAGVLDHTSDSTETSLDFTGAGTPAAPIVFSNYPGASFTISNSGPDNPSINLYGCSWVKVFGINSTNAYRMPILQYCTNCELAYCSFGGGNTNYGYKPPLSMWNDCQSNWIHNNVVGPSTPFFNTEAGAEDGGAHGFSVGQFYATNDFTSYNIIESNTFFHGGHDVLSVYGPSNLVQYNWCHSAPWYAFTNILWGSRDLELGGTIGNYNLVQFNDFDHAGYVPDEGCHGVEMSDGAYEIFRHNYCVNDGACGIVVYGNKVGGTLSCSNYIYNNTLAFDGYNLTYATNGTPTNVSFPVWQNIMAFKSTEYNFVVNNLAYNNYTNSTMYFDGYSVDISRWANNMTNTDPLFANTNNTSGEFVMALPNCTLQAASPAINAGTWLAFITSSSGSGTSFTVDNAGYFSGTTYTAGSRTVLPDAIQLQGQTNTGQIVSILGNMITVASPLTWTNGQGLALPYGGSAPDVGAYEHFPILPPTNLRIVGLAP